jgi:signal transduction histidine kinase
MKIHTAGPEHESPARRLEILYVASLIAVAILSAVSQTLIIRELSWQSTTLSTIGQVARQQSIDRSLSLAALAIEAGGGASAGPERIEALRSAVRLHDLDAVGPASVRSGDRSEVGLEGRLRRAERYRRAAVGSAKELLARLEAKGDDKRPGGPEVATLVRSIAADEVAYGREVGEAATLAEVEASGHIDRLKSTELKLCGFVMVVLLLEGFFVISPAVRRIQTFMTEMNQTHEELRSYAAKLELSNKELQDFASVASHDLQEPLRKVQAFSDRLRSRCGASLDDSGRDYLDRIQNAARRMQILINDLLTYARVTTKAQPFAPVDLSVAAREVVADLEARIEQVEGRVEVGELPTVDVDPLQVRQLMQNLIGNALKYHRPHVPPVVRVYSKVAREDHPEAAGDLAHGHCQLVVEDNGIGFEEIYTDRIFTIFQRLHGRNEYEGTGIGLAVCRKIAERHGGSITARSTPGQGSTFLVTLPVRQTKEVLADDNASPSDLDPGRRR